MKKTKSLAASAGSSAGPVAEPRHRSGAVARMLGMPVATLRVWERRYALTQPELSPSGQRLYSAHDVRRLALLKQLTDLGHAIGSLAGLDMPQLQGVASTHAHARGTAQTDAHLPAPIEVPVPAPAWRLAVVGAALARRLLRPALLRRLGRPVVLLGPFDDISQAAAALRGSDVDTLVLQESHLQVDWLAGIDAVAPALVQVPKAVLYGFAADTVCEALATAGVALMRGPQPDAVVAQWLDSLSLVSSARQPSGAMSERSADEVPPRRWGDAALVDFASRSSSIACECPRHLAELLMQLAHFEAYSAECEHRHAADAELHAYLRGVAAASRARFEAALEHVALLEGLALPSALGRGLSSGIHDLGR